MCRKEPIQMKKLSHSVQNFTIFNIQCSSCHHIHLNSSFPGNGAYIVHSSCVPGRLDSTVSKCFPSMGGSQLAPAVTEWYCLSSVSSKQLVDDKDHLPPRPHQCKLKRWKMTGLLGVEPQSFSPADYSLFLKNLFFAENKENVKSANLLPFAAFLTPFHDAIRWLPSLPAAAAPTFPRRSSSQARKCARVSTAASTRRSRPLPFVTTSRQSTSPTQASMERRSRPRRTRTSATTTAPTRPPAPTRWARCTAAKLNLGNCVCPVY